MKPGTSKFISFNCKNVHRSIDCVKCLCRDADIIALQETWLLPHDLPTLGTIDDNFAFTGKSAVDTSKGILRGRPYGGVALLWRKSAFPCVSVIECHSVRLTAIRILIDGGRSVLVISVYMPTDTAENLTEFTDCMSEISALVEVSNSESVYVLGDFNAHPGEQFSHELINFCNEQLWSCVDLDLLPSDTYTYVSEAHGCRRWLDHCIVTKAARQSVVDVSVLNQNVYWSDHYPLCIECDINKCLPKLVTPVQSYSKIRWGVRDESQILKYTEACNARLRLIDFPEEFRDCADKICCNVDHKLKIAALYQDIVCALKESAEGSYNEQKRKKYKCKIGWNKHVRDAHREAQFWYRSWLQYGKPSSGFIYNKMWDYVAIRLRNPKNAQFL